MKHVCRQVLRRDYGVEADHVEPGGHVIHPAEWSPALLGR